MNQSIVEAIKTAERHAYEAREAIRAQVDATEAAAAKLAKSGEYAAAIAKYEEGERGREAYDRLCSDNATFNTIIQRFPNLSTMPPEREEFGISAARLPGVKVERRDGSGVGLVVYTVRQALIAIATNPKGGIYRNWNQHTHAFCEDGCDLRSDIGAIPRWVIAELQVVGVIDQWTRVVGHHGYVVAGINPKRTCELLANGAEDLEARCAAALAKLVAIHEERLAHEKVKRDNRNVRARTRRAAKRVVATSP